MDSSGGWEISNTNLSTGWCSLSMMTTATFSASFWWGNERLKCVSTQRRHGHVKQTSLSGHDLPSQWGASHNEVYLGCIDLALDDMTSGNEKHQTLEEPFLRYKQVSPPNRGSEWHIYPPVPAQARCISFSSEIFPRDKLHAHTGWDE